MARAARRQGGSQARKKGYSRRARSEGVLKILRGASIPAITTQGYAVVRPVNVQVAAWGALVPCVFKTLGPRRVSGLTLQSSLAVAVPSTGR